MEAITTAIKDLIKYSIIQHVNTGDKTFDNLINAVLLAILAYVFATEFNKKIYNYCFNYFVHNKNGPIQSEQYEYYLKMVNEPDFIQNKYRTSWYIQEEEEFTKKLITFCKANLSYSFTNIIDTKTKLPSQKYVNNYSSIPQHIFGTNNNTVPLYIYNNDIIALHKGTDAKVFLYKNKETLNNFIDYINSIALDDKPVNENKNMLIYYYNNEEQIDFIYPDRTFDNIVTKYKSNIIGLLDTFKNINKNNTSLYNGFGTYNIGFLLHGLPGTGKTSIIKAIANYLQRDVYIIDMTKIKTKVEFCEIFKNISKRIFVLEEFDCVQGVIKKRTGKEHEQNTSSNIELLKREKMEILALMASAKEDEIKKQCNKELEDINKKINDLNNELTLDTMLTVLDGVIEMRNRVIIATTNHIENIDPALLREGRFDFKIQLGRYNNIEIRELLCLMLKNKLSNKEIKRIQNTCFKEYIYTPVEIINIVYTNQGDIEKILTILRE